MDFAVTSRAKGAKYGKNKSRAQLHNFYDVSANATTTTSASKRLPISPSSVGTEQRGRNAPGIPMDPPSPSPARSLRPAHITTHSRSSVSTSHDSRSTSPTKHETGPLVDVGSSAFDLLSSDDDLDVAERRPVKKLRLSPMQQQEKQDTAKSTSLHLKKHEKIALRGPVKKQKEDISQRSPRDKLNTKRVETKTTSQEQIGTRSEAISTVPDAMTELKLKPTKMKYSKKSRETIRTKEFDKDEAQQPQPIAQKSRTRLKSRTLESSTPKRSQQPVESSDTSGASPSQLGIDHLRLTTDTSPEPAVISETLLTNEPVPVLSRGRKRLVDRLDAGTSQPKPRVEVVATNFAKEVENLHRGNEIEKASSSSEIPKLSRTGSSQTRQTYGRPRNTYAKERSHLSDMVDDLDAMSTASSQGPSQQLLSGMLINGPSQLQSQLEIESDSSEDAPNFRLKSIYELKQAGTNNRLEKEVEDLMADINPTSGSKAVRIQALMQTIRKMSQEGFAAFLFEYALDRFTAWSSLVKDKMSKLLLGMVFWRLTHCNTTSPPRLKQIIHCVVTNSSSLPPLGTIAQIARTRAENLSKSTIRDLVDFEQTVLLEGLLPAYEGEGVISAAITLGVLNESLRKIIDAGTTVQLPRSSYSQIVALLQQVSQPSDDQVVKHVFVTKLALSLLQICAGPLEQDLGLSQAEYQALGDTLGDIVRRSLNIHESLVQSVLHFAITLCNDKPDVCQAICQSSLPTPLMAIIRSRFLGLVDAAKDSQEVELLTLDSIILTLACLLNLTEHSNEVRRIFATSKSDDDTSTHLARLVSIYTHSAPRLQAVKTMEQGSALVMVGYLSLLICNLCLDEGLWYDVSHQLSERYSISDIVASAKELLIHLRTVETTDESDTPEKGSAALDGFTMRFGDILSAVRLE